MIKRIEIAEALASASDTKALRLGPGVLAETPAVFRQSFGQFAVPLLIADPNTFAAAGRRALDLLAQAGLNPLPPFVLERPYAGIEDVLRIQERIAQQPCIPVAVGSGTINDLVKLAAGRSQLPYLCIATAASMDGYTAYGASITADGSKQTFTCPAPRAVIADSEILGAAPAHLNAAGYADLAAKIPAGADWLLADALGQEAIEPKAWAMVQAPLRHWLRDPQGVRAGKPEAMSDLIEGLLMTGFAMQHCRSSRPASGAEHQFSHLWDMQHHTHNGVAPLHGCKVAIGSLAMTRLYERLFAQPIETLDIDQALAHWPTKDQLIAKINDLLPAADLNKVALVESQAKYIDHAALRSHLEQLKKLWPTLKNKLQAQLIPSPQLTDMFRQAGVPTDSAQIGITPRRLSRSHDKAQLIRRRFTGLDLAAWLGVLTPAA